MEEHLFQSYINLFSRVFQAEAETPSQLPTAGGAAASFGSSSAGRTNGDGLIGLTFRAKDRIARPKAQKRSWKVILRWYLPRKSTSLE
jgi:hypothetical protein